jgi:hypothetical protein
MTAEFPMLAVWAANGIFLNLHRISDHGEPDFRRKEILVGDLLVQFHDGIPFKDFAFAHL